MSLAFGASLSFRKIGFCHLTRYRDVGFVVVSDSTNRSNAAATSSYAGFNFVSSLLMATVIIQRRCGMKIPPRKH